MTRSKSASQARRAPRRGRFAICYLLFAIRERASGEFGPASRNPFDVFAEIGVFAFEQIG